MKVTEHKSFQNRSQNECSKVDGIKSPVFSVNPIETRINPPEKLTVYSTVHSPEQGRIKGNDSESPFYAESTQTLGIQAHEGNNWQELEHDGIIQISNNGEDRIRTCGTHTSSRI